MKSKNKIYIIAEAGVNHNGSFIRAKKMIKEAKKCGANAIKFQSYITKNMIIDNVAKADYQKTLSNRKESQKKMLEKYELKNEDFLKLRDYAKKNKIDLFSTPFDNDSLDFLLKKVKVPYIKISSTDITNVPLLINVGKSKKKVFLSSGMSTLTDIDIALSALIFGKLGIKNKFLITKHRNIYKKHIGYLKRKVVLMHCTTEYPAPIDELNLNVLDTYVKKYNIPIGYSDHSHNLLTPIIVSSKNICAIEAHVTINNNLSGPDHKSSFSFKEFKEYVKNIRDTETMKGFFTKQITKSEKKNMVYARKSLVLNKDIKKGERLNASTLAVKRPGYGISPIHYFSFIGKKAIKDMNKDEVISKSCFSKK